MEEREEIMNLILGRKEEKEGNRMSTLQMALSVARYLACYKLGQAYTWIGFKFDRNMGKNEYETLWRPTNPKSDILAALYLYLNALEQIGVMFFQDERNKKLNGIKLVMQKYSSMKNDKGMKKKITAIKCLRHSLAHNFGLVSSGKEKYKYILLFDDDERNSIVELPDDSWKGTWTDKNDNTSTKIYVINLIKEIESIIEKVQSDSEITFAKDIEEIKSRFTIITE